MKKASRPKLALAAVFPAAAIPILLPVLRQTDAPDFVQGSVVGVLLGMALLLIALAVDPRAV